MLSVSLCKQFHLPSPGMTDLEHIFNGIVKDYSERLYWHVRRMVGSHEDADDLLQDIFLKIWTALPSFRGEAQLYTWVWRIATNETLNWLRKEKVRALLRFASADELAVQKVYGERYSLPWLMPSMVRNERE